MGNFFFFLLNCRGIIQEPLFLFCLFVLSWSSYHVEVVQRSKKKKKTEKHFHMGWCFIFHMFLNSTRLRHWCWKHGKERKLVYSHQEGFFLQLQGEAATHCKFLILFMMSEILGISCKVVIFRKMSCRTLMELRKIFCFLIVLCKFVIKFITTLIMKSCFQE